MDCICSVPGLLPTGPLLTPSCLTSTPWSFCWPCDQACNIACMNLMITAADLFTSVARQASVCVEKQQSSFSNTLDLIFLDARLSCFLLCKGNVPCRFFTRWVKQLFWQPRHNWRWSYIGAKAAPTLKSNTFNLLALVIINNKTYFL